MCIPSPYSGQRDLWLLRGAAETRMKDAERFESPHYVGISSLEDAQLWSAILFSFFPEGAGEGCHPPGPSLTRPGGLRDEFFGTLWTSMYTHTFVTETLLLQRYPLYRYA